MELDRITQALDTALALVANPQVLYDALPEGLKLQLVQTVFEKIWILDTAVVGSDLTEPFAELLTREAQLALTEQQQRASDDVITRGRTNDAGTYYRRRTSVDDGAWDRPYVERPHGPLPIDTENPSPYGGQGSNIEHLVEHKGLKPLTSSMPWKRSNQLS